MSEEVVLRPEGELDLAGVEPLRATWYTLADDVAPAVIVVDLARVTFADATFVGLVVGVRRRQAAHGGAVRVCNAAPQVRRLFTLTGLRQLLGETGAPGAARVVDLRVPRPGGPRTALDAVEGLTRE